MLIDCPDRKGVVARVSGLLHERGANILHADQHRDQVEDLVARGRDVKRVGCRGRCAGTWTGGSYATGTRRWCLIDSRQKAADNGQRDRGFTGRSDFGTLEGNVLHVNKG